MSKALRSNGGPKQGKPFPDFDLRTVAGERIRKADYVGRRPLFLVCGPIPSPESKSAESALRRLYDEYSDRVAFVTLYLPAERSERADGQSDTLEQKLVRAREYQYRERIPWTVAVDDFDATLERALHVKEGAVYLMARDGNVAFRPLQGSDEQSLSEALNAITAEPAQDEAPPSASTLRRIAAAYRSRPAPVRAAVGLAAGLVALALVAAGWRMFKQGSG